jgi:plasmid stability protein
MSCPMKTTLNLDDSVMQRLRREAARQGKTMSELMESALRLFFQLQERPRTAAELPELPVFASGGARVDVADRNALYEVMDEA